MQLINQTGAGRPRRVARSRITLALCAAAFALALQSPSAQAAAPEGALDNRAWELVSPVEKNGGEVGAPGTAAAGALQAAAAGGALAFGSTASFGEAQGAAPVSQYLASRGAGGWSTANLTPPLLSGTYEGDPYLLFSEDLTRAILSSGWACRDGGAECAEENPPLGPGGPAGYRNLYLREGATYTPLITAANFPALPAEPKDFHLAPQGASPDLRHAVFAADSELYEWSEGSVALISSTPGAALAAPTGAVSEDGSRVYFTAAGNLYLYLREGAATKPLDGAQGGGGSFGAASADGSLAFFTVAGHLYRYDAATEVATDLTPSGGVQGVLGASADGSWLYYLTATKILLLHGGTTTTVTSIANPAKYPPAAGSARIAAAGARLFFDSAEKLAAADTDGGGDVYEWEAQGTGSCAKSPGCLALISSGRSASARLAAASASGDDAFFATAASLLPFDTGSLDLYDARTGGGLPEPPSVIPCEGDDCQGPPPGPEDPTPGTATLEGPHNPPVHYPTVHCPKGKHRVVHHAISSCVAKHHRERHRRKRPSHHLPGGRR